MISWHSGRASAVRQRSRYRWRSMNVVRRKPRLATRLIKERGPVSTEVKGCGICFDGALWLPKSARAWAHSWQNSSAKGRSRMTARGRASLRFRALTRFLSWRNDMDSPLGLVAKGQAGNFDFPAISAHFRPFPPVTGGWACWGRVHRDNGSGVYQELGRGKCQVCFTTEHAERRLTSKNSVVSASGPFHSWESALSFRERVRVRAFPRRKQPLMRRTPHPNPPPCAGEGK